MISKVRTVDFLPEIFRTDTNKQFLTATLDVLTQQPNLARVEGYIGEKYGYGIQPDDSYVVEPTSSRRNYQLDPSVIFLKPETQIAQDFISYPGIVNALENQNALVNDANRLFESEFYSWDPFVDYDKIVNYAQYYWIPSGPDAIPITVTGDITAVILGQTNYTSDNGIVFTNGLKVLFDSTVVPSFYAETEYFVEGVGTGITLLPVDSYIVTESSGGLVYGLWDQDSWDISQWDAESYVSVFPDYITISRNSRDYNAWTRSNRWFHQQVIDTTTSALGQVTSISSNKITRAQRPILEFRGNLKLFDSGLTSLGSISFFDTAITNALATVNGQTSYIIDGQTVSAGELIVFAADSDYTVRSTVYRIDFVPAGPGSTNVITLVPVYYAIDQSQVNIKRGVINSGKTFRWNTDTNSWVSCQLKTGINQSPLFDIFDSDGISLGNNDIYQSTTFVGCKLFSYTLGTGKNDPILGFPIQYSSITNIGDINFTVNLNSDTFTFKDSRNSIVTESVNTGFVHYYDTSSSYSKLTGWVPAAGPSIQYQIFEYHNTSDADTFVADIPAVAEIDTPWQPVQVYVNDNILDASEYTVTVDLTNQTTTVVLDTSAAPNSQVTLLIYSNSSSSVGYYSIPSNLQNNPFNQNIVSVDVGDIRNQYVTIYSNVTAVTGELYGYNNIHDLGNLNSYGTSIIQNSSSLVLPGLFLRKPQINFFDALQYNKDQYLIYKSLITDLAFNNDYSQDQQPAEILDSIIYQITQTKSNGTAFFWTDTLYSGAPAVVNTYTFGATPISAIFTLDRVYTTDSANYYAVALYLTRTVNGEARTTQLLRGIDYVISQTTSSVTVTYPLQAGDSLVIKEYNQTYGSYCPSTPSSMGLFPCFVPQIIYDEAALMPAYFIRGHDGSMTRCYGEIIDGALTDFRDIALLEFETRIFNNIKTKNSIPLELSDVIPGEFRTTDYNWQEILSIYSTQFLNWIGTNRIDYKTQYYNLMNPFTYNYNQSSDKITNNAILQGYWRGIYRWLYDTDAPDQRPWELLGLSIKPSWWDSRYGIQPYTSGNIYMWTDIANGYVWNDGDYYTDSRYQRPGLLTVLPVDSAGNLRNPFDVIVGNYNKLTFKKDWIVGDQGPAESAYLKSSDWPFDAMRLLALTKPAKFFNLFVDLDDYKYDADLQQYLWNGRQHLDPKLLEIYGNGTAKNSYINWVVDYVNVSGVDGWSLVSTLVKNTDVRLTYNMAGFSAKDYLKFYIERATPNSKNTSFLIPDESYSLLLYDNVPEEQIFYSSIIVQKVRNGWTVYGNGKNRNYFTIASSKTNGVYKKITANSVTVTVSTDWYRDRNSMVPYGTLFYGQQAVAEFINNYGQYLTQQGVLAENIGQGIVYDWDQSIKEFLAWSQQDWELGSMIALNPNAQYLTVLRPGLVVNPLTVSDKNFVLNQNLVPIQSQDATIIRDNEKFSIKILNDGDTVSYTNLNCSSLEHAIVFDNNTVFNDVIYNVVTGLRQSRLLLKGYKTAEWNGYLDTQGFILNENNISEWQNNKKYAKGQIVTHKNLYWVAGTLIEPGVEFDTSKWFKIEYTDIKQGLLPNPSTNAYESLYYYDVNKANLELDADLLSYGLIGYQPREYLAAADLSDVTTINVYKNIIREKGTRLLAEGFRNAKLDQGVTDYNIYENWAIQYGSFGKISSSNYVEATLDQNLLTGNPTLLAFSTAGTVEQAQQTVLLSEIINYERAPNSQNFLPSYTTNYSIEQGLPTAGYVNKNDVQYSVFEFSELNDDSTIIDTIRNGDIVWIAKYKNSWEVFTAQALNSTVINSINNLNGTRTVSFSTPHGLISGDLLAINNFSTDINGFYTVKSVNNIYSITVDLLNAGGQLTVNGTGTALRLVSSRYQQASDLATDTVAFRPFNKKLSWIDSDSSGNWRVLANRPVFQEQNFSVTSSQDFGSSVAYSDKLGSLIGDSTLGLVTVINSTITTLSGASGFGKRILVTDDCLYIASDLYVYCYRINTENVPLLTQQLALSATTSSISDIAVSEDNSWLYISKKAVGEIELRHRNSVTDLFESTGSLITAPSGALEWGTSIASSTDGVKLIVGAPQETVAGLQNAGAVYVYSRSYQQYLANGTTTSYVVGGTVYTNRVDVTVNGILISPTQYSIIGSNTIQFITAPEDGAVVRVSYDEITQIQRLTSDTPVIGALFGTSVDTNRFGSNIVTGAPVDINTVDNVGGVEGSAYQFCNSGQRYGQITLVNPTVLSGDIVYIDGYQITFSSTTSSAVVIAAQINAQELTNIVAVANGSVLTLGTKSETAEVSGNIIDFVASQAVQTRLNLVSYYNTQKILNTDLSNVSRFGQVVKMNERDGLLISAITSASRHPTTFDYTNDCVINDTIFDGDCTTFIDEFSDTGTVYQYTYLDAYSESISNPGQYVFGQYCNTDDTSYGYQPKFGSALAYREDVIVVGAPNWTDSVGFATKFVPEDFDCYEPSNTSWYSIKSSILPVNINRINNISIYDVRTNNTIEYLDYIDPVQGKLLGAVASNLDYIGSTDPAGYSTNGIQWGPSQVGQIWLDTTNLRMYNYYQPDAVYNAVHWGQAYTGSTADIYTWVESALSPLDYAGGGAILDVTQYVVQQTYDAAKNAVVDTYYFWVKNLDVIPPGKTLSPLTLAQYILNPISSGIPYISASTVLHNGSYANIVALYNTGSIIADISTALHIGYGNNLLQDVKHTQWKLINSNNESAFLPGFPVISIENPSDLYLKYLDSFAGMDSEYNLVPDPSLPLLVQSGVNFYPRQSMYINRRLALQNFVEYANSILSTQPIRETRSLNLLETNNTIEGFTMLSSCRTATNSNLTATYSNGTLGVGATLTGTGVMPSISGVTLSTGNRVLVKNQTQALENGIYTVTSISPNWILTRSVDFDSDLTTGLSTAIVNGTLLGTVWTLTNTGLITVGTTALNFAFTSSVPRYDTREFWEYTDWWATGYDSTVKPVLEVPNYIALQTLVSGNLITGTNGLIVELTDGLIVKVKLNEQGFSEYYRYTVVANISYWQRIGVQNGTIQIKSELWTNNYAWDDNPWDYEPWNRTQGIEVRNIVRWINEVLYTNDLLQERNNSLMLMFNFIQSENLERSNYNPWLTKTSLIDVKQQIRKLLQYKTYQRDNQEFLEGYLNEIKPFHVKIKNFIYSYSGTEFYYNNATDFDLPAVLNTDTITFNSPQLVYQLPLAENQYLPSDPIWNLEQYKSWYDNYGLSISTTTREVLNIARLAVSMTVSSDTVALTSTLGLNDTGVVLIDDEQIYYDSIDRTLDVLGNLQRGYNSTTIIGHNADAPVYITATPILILNAGRGYLSAPAITASVDVTGYPLPRANAEFQTAISSNGSLSVAELAVSGGQPVTGSGYPVTPNITVAGSSITGTFNQTNIGANNQITISAHPFITGDTVVYTTSNTSINYGPVNNQYYYVRKIDNNTIALYNTANDSANSWIGVTTLVGSINSSTTTIVVVNGDILPNSSNIIEIDDERISYTGINYSTNTLLGVVRGVSGTVAQSHSTGSQVRVNSNKRAAADLERVKLLSGANTASVTLTSTARVEIFTESYPTRMFNIRMSLDRVSYTSNYRIENFYEPTVNMPGVNLPQLMSGVEYPNAIYQGINFSFSGTPLGWDLDGVLGWDLDGVLGWDGSVQSPLNTILTSPAFANNIPTIYTVEGGQFPDGYAPEELVPGLVTDNLTINVISNDGVLNYRQTVNKSGIAQTFNANPYTQTELESTLTPTSNTITVTSANTLIDATFSNTGNIILINGEYIRFRSVNYATNTLGDLERGINNTPVSSTIVGGTVAATALQPGILYRIVSVGSTNFLSGGAGANTVGTVFYANSNCVNLTGTGTVKPVVQSVLLANKLNDDWQNQWWYGPPSSTMANTTLVTNTSVPALFLQKISP